MYMIGVDEVGRGPLAGPVAVGVACVPEGFDWGQLPGVGDSKGVKVENREAIFGQATSLRQAGVLDFRVAMVGSEMIDREGIVAAVRVAMARALSRLGLSEVEKRLALVKLDGGLQAPAPYLQQETIIKGDAKEPVIGLASIVAKVTRDRYMERKGAEPLFAPYGFAAHKGYGTKAHIAAIENHGLSSIHRKTFCKRFTV